MRNSELSKCFVDICIDIFHIYFAFLKVRYRFATEESNVFRLDPKSGCLYVEKKLSKQHYHLRVEAVDGGGMASENQVSI